jgi:uridylate kinase
MGMLATVINAIALKSALCGMGIDARVLSAVSMDKFAELADADRADAHLKKGRAVIYAGGTGNPFFTTDSAAALRAAEIGADALLKATKVDGIYSADPVKNRDAVRFTRLSYSDAIAKRLKVMDSSAFSICMDAGIPIVVFDFMKEGNLEKVLTGQPVGTLVS